MHTTVFNHQGHKEHKEKPPALCPSCSSWLNSFDRKVKAGRQISRKGAKAKKNLYALAALRETFSSIPNRLAPRSTNPPSPPAPLPKGEGSLAPCPSPGRRGELTYDSQRRGRFPFAAGEVGHVDRIAPRGDRLLAQGADRAPRRPRRRRPGRAARRGAGNRPSARASASPCRRARRAWWPARPASCNSGCSYFLKNSSSFSPCVQSSPPGVRPSIKQPIGIAPERAAAAFDEVDAGVRLRRGLVPLHEDRRGPAPS